MPAPRPSRISDIMPKLQNVALTSTYFVRFSLPASGLRPFLRRKGINDRFIAENVGLLCSNAALPGSAMASQNITGDYQGLVERFAHTRNFTQINFEFYVDNEYKSMKFLEHWMEYISGGNQVDPSSDTYYFQMNYPRNYKSNDTRIVKFEKDHFRFLEYRFVGLFPLSLNSVRVQYGNSTILKATCSFSYDRYIAGESSSLARDLRRAFNDLGFGRGNPVRDGFGIKDDTLNTIARQSAFKYLNIDNPTGSYPSLVRDRGGTRINQLPIGVNFNPPGITP